MRVGLVPRGVGALRLRQRRHCVRGRGRAPSAGSPRSAASHPALRARDASADVARVAVERHREAVGADGADQRRAAHPSSGGSQAPRRPRRRCAPSRAHAAARAGRSPRCDAHEPVAAARGRTRDRRRRRRLQISRGHSTPAHRTIRSALQHLDEIVEVIGPQPPVADAPRSVRASAIARLLEHRRVVRQQHPVAAARERALAFVANPDRFSPVRDRPAPRRRARGRGNDW